MFKPYNNRCLYTPILLAKRQGYLMLSVSQFGSDRLEVFGDIF